MIRDRFIPTPPRKNTAEKGELETLVTATGVSVQTHLS